MAGGGDGARGDIGSVQRREGGTGADEAGGGADAGRPIDGESSPNTGRDVSGVESERPTTNVNSHPECRGSPLVDCEESTAHGHGATAKIDVSRMDSQPAGAAVTPNGHPATGRVDGEIAQSRVEGTGPKSDLAAVDPECLALHFTGYEGASCNGEISTRAVDAPIAKQNAAARVQNRNVAGRDAGVQGRTVAGPQTRKSDCHGADRAIDALNRALTGNQQLHPACQSGGVAIAA